MSSRLACSASRARVAEGMSRDADYLENVQRHLVAIADAADAGELPRSLSGARSRAQVEDLLRYQAMPRMTLHRTYINDLLEAGRGIPGTVLRQVERPDPVTFEKSCTV